MAEENKIKVNDLPEDKKEQTEETELPVINNEEKRVRKRAPVRRRWASLSGIRRNIDKH